MSVRNNKHNFFGARRAHSRSFIEKIHGFTLIELLVVVAIIGLLASVVLASLSSARYEARITRTVTDLKQIETSMLLWMQGSGRVVWPHEDTISPGPNVTMTEFRNVTTLDQYLTEAPDTLFGDEEYTYDNGHDAFTCGGGASRGVNIFVGNIDDRETIEKINEIIDDDGSLACGKVKRHGNGHLMYMLSKDKTF